MTRRVTVLSGGVGGARMARGFLLPGVDLTVVVNVGDDDEAYGLPFSPDLDTVLYTLAGIEGPQGWGVAGDTFHTLAALERFGWDTTLAVGDQDLALLLTRAVRLRSGGLASATAFLAEKLGVQATVLPATEDELRTQVLGPDGWMSFQEYFVHRRHDVPIRDVRFRGASTARPTPGALAAIEDADLLVIAPSNPVLSIWPMLAVPGIADAVAAHPLTVAVSPLFGGKAVKGPAAEVLSALGLGTGNAAVLAAYGDIVDVFVVDEGDAHDIETVGRPGLDVVALDTRIAAPDEARRLAGALLELAAGR